MLNFNNILLGSINLNNDEELMIFAALEKLIDIIKDPYELTNLLAKNNSNESIISIFSSIGMLLGEVKEWISTDINVDELSYEYMVLIRKLIQHSEYFGLSLFGGLADLGFGINSIYLGTGHFRKFVDSFNELIISLIERQLPRLISDINNLKIQSFDIMSGMTGVASYLMLYKDQEDIRKVIEHILKYLIMLTQKREIYGYSVPNYYISSENQFLDVEKEIYPKGNFNFGISHGITGPLAILAIAMKDGIEIEGQKEAMEKILEDLKEFTYINQKGAVYWPGRISFDDYIDKIRAEEISRASWCYGTPGIARSMYLAGEQLNDIDSIELSLDAIDGLCKMQTSEWMLNSPTICHGYAGLLAIVQSMYENTNKIAYKQCIRRLCKTILSYYKDDSMFGFMNIDPKEIEKGKYEMIEEDKITFLQGSIGIVLALLNVLRKPKTNWRKHLLIDWFSRSYNCLGDYN